jgi:hypothetical protein
MQVFVNAGEYLDAGGIYKYQLRWSHTRLTTWEYWEYGIWLEHVTSPPASSYAIDSPPATYHKYFKIVEYYSTLILEAVFNSSLNYFVRQPYTLFPVVHFMTVAFEFNPINQTVLQSYWLYYSRKICFTSPRRRILSCWQVLQQIKCGSKLSCGSHFLCRGQYLSGAASSSSVGPVRRCTTFLRPNSLRDAFLDLCDFTVSFWEDDDWT